MFGRKHKRQQIEVVKMVREEAGDPNGRYKWMLQRARMPEGEAESAITLALETNLPPRLIPEYAKQHARGKGVILQGRPTGPPGQSNDNG